MLIPEKLREQTILSPMNLKLCLKRQSMTHFSRACFNFPNRAYDLVL